MRIITGQFKSRQIKTPQGIRPSEDRLRKSLFDILGDVSGLSLLDLFAGSGSVGLEALSRAAQKAVFVDNSRLSCRSIETNLGALGCGDKAEVICQDAFRVTGNLASKGVKFDLIFLDPPYYRDLAEKMLQILGVCDILLLSGYVIIQHFRKDPVSEKAGNLVLWRQERYGDSLLSFYKRG